MDEKKPGDLFSFAAVCRAAGLPPLKEEETENDER